jgi:DNA polymerase (family X)
MRNAEIAAALDELGTLYELDGAVRYRVNAYRDAARTVRDCPVSVEELARAGRATELAGIGKTLQEKILALVDTGEIPSAVKLKQKFPPTLIAVTRVPGLGAKTARRLFDELEIASLDDLRAAAEAQKIRELRGLGAKAEESILASLERMEDVDEDAAGRLLLSDVLPVAEELAEAMREHPAADRVEVAGSVRRRTETCKDIDLIATAEDPKALAEHLASHPLISAAGSPGTSGTRALTHNGIPVDLRIVAPDFFGNLLQHFTGSAAHNVQLREDAVARGFSVSEHGITETESGEVLRCVTEEEVYERLGYSYIEPELREGTGELRAARDGKLPELVELGDLRGDLHSHTTLSDGKATLEEMAEAARGRGYSYFAITDHSASHGFGDDVSAERLWERIEEVRGLDANLPRFHLLAGSEINIGLDGGLDYPDDLVAALDWVVASVHTRFSDDQKFMTGRILEAIENPLVDCIGHLTGRMLGRREPYPVDIEKVAEAAARTGTMLEINGNPNRRDLSERNARLAAEAGAMIVLNTDAHRVRTLDNMRYGIATARRAWLTKEKIANTRAWREFTRLRKPSRRRGGDK